MMGDWDGMTCPNCRSTDTRNSEVKELMQGENPRFLSRHFCLNCDATYYLYDAINLAIQPTYFERWWHQFDMESLPMDGENVLCTNGKSVWLYVFPAGITTEEKRLIVDTFNRSKVEWRRIGALPKEKKERS